MFQCPGVHLAKDPGYRSVLSSQGKSRRQSMLL